MSKYNPIYRSPIAVTEAESTTSGLRISDLTGVSVTVTQGDASEALSKYFATIPTKPGDLVDVGSGLLARLTPTEFYLFGKSSAAELPSDSELEESYRQVNSNAHTTDYTHGRALLKLTGADAAEALSKICGLDFYDTVFPNMQVKQTSAAKIKTLIARCDEEGEPTYHLHVNRPLGQYFWSILWDAGQEFGIQVA